MATKTKKRYRRFVRVGTKLVPSPSFRTKADADDWYDKIHRKAQFGKFGLQPLVRVKDIPLFLDVAAEVMDEREKVHGKNTTVGEDRNLKLHILPKLGHLQVHTITPKIIEKLLNEMVVVKPIRGGKSVLAPASLSTQNKVKALLSVIFEHLLDDENPVIPFNPVRRLTRKKKGPRKAHGQKLPTKMLPNDEACLKFLEAAGRIGSGATAPDAIAVRGRSFVYASSMLMLGPRISELQALKWSYIDFKNHTITFAWVFERNSKTLKQRTKKGEFEARIIPMPRELEKILRWWKETSGHNGPDDFVLSKPGGGHMTTSTIRQLHNRICKLSGQEVSHHGLRHTFGRLFNKRTGNLSALQEILGHSSITTTQIYAKLNAEQLQSFSDDMEIKKNGETATIALPSFGSKRSTKE